MVHFLAMTQLRCDPATKQSTASATKVEVNGKICGCPDVGGTVNGKICGCPDVGGTVVTEGSRINRN